MFTWFLLLVFYVPLQIALNPGVFFDWLAFDLSSLRVFILFFFCVRLIFRFSIRDFFASIFTYQGLALLLFLLISGLSLFSAENIWWGLRKMLFFLSVFPLFFLTFYLADDLTKIKRVILSLVEGSGLLALIGLSQFLFQFIFGLENTYEFWALNIVPVFSGFNLGAMILTYPSWLVNVAGQTIMRAFSLFSDPHMFSFFTGLLFFLSLGLVLTGKNGRKRGFLIFWSFLFYLSGLLSFSRGAYLGIFISILCLAVLTCKYLSQKKAAVCLCLLLIVFLIPNNPFSDRFYSSFDPSEGSNSGRLFMWQKTLDFGFGHPWWGVGLGNYSLALDSGFDYYNPVTAHNLYLDLFSEVGIFGLLVWLFLILGTLKQLWVCFGRSEGEIKSIILGLIGALIYLSVHSFFETGIFHPSVLAVLMIILGISAVITNKCFKKSSISLSA